MRSDTGNGLSILLLDMDGVLLEPGGYHEAARASVRTVGQLLGFGGVELSQENLHDLEACGVTNEWDTVAMSLAVLAERLWAHRPHEEIGAHLLRRPLAPHSVEAPSLDDFVRRMLGPDVQHAQKLERARLLLGERTHGLLDQAYSMEGLSQPIQQEHVLGSATFSQTYGMPANFELPSYLLEYDRSHLVDGLRGELLAWNEVPGNRAVIFTNRPSRAPDGLFSTPEAELGAQLVGLESLPLAATGGVVWLEAQRGKPPSTYNKGHPVHALAAMQRALGVEVREAFDRAGRLAEDGIADGVWRPFEGARVTVFEDATGGFASLLAAGDILRRTQVSIDINLVGISPEASKRTALEGMGGRVYADLPAALGTFLAGNL